VRADGHVYIEHRSATGPSNGKCIRSTESELYDLERDPFQLTNLFPPVPGTPAAATRSALLARLRDLRRCAGVAGRDPVPASGQHCE
jgi:hypothetical protein